MRVAAMSNRSSSAALGGNSTERVYLESAGASISDSWWESYKCMMSAASISATSEEVTERDSEYILRRGILGAGRAGEMSWPASRVRRGLVMGAVQSGKTASMLGVAARSLDQNVDAVVVLAGT